MTLAFNSRQKIFNASIRIIAIVGPFNESEIFPLRERNE